MNKLTIEDLSATRELDRRQMSAVRGGLLGLWPLYPSYSVDTTNFSAQQLIGQTANVVNNTGNDVAFAANIHSTVNPMQNAHNTINF
ncbi:hypothetical protein [Burkholderia guangdongensis]|uniref:hypothetical protein n=1 Tax=Burkholderia guangdongensis TaxID=1792500 RepID=UPI0015CA0A92|nr:hypothetical protein [Burkholderia guangdongensis]